MRFVGVEQIPPPTQAPPRAAALRPTPLLLTVRPSCPRPHDLHTEPIRCDVWTVRVSHWHAAQLLGHWPGRRAAAAVQDNRRPHEGDDDKSLQVVPSPRVAAHSSRGCVGRRPLVTPHTWSASGPAASSPVKPSHHRPPFRSARLTLTLPCPYWHHARAHCTGTLGSKALNTIRLDAGSTATTDVSGCSLVLTLCTGTKAL